MSLQFAENNVPKHVLAILFLDCLHIYMFLRQMSHSKTIQLAKKSPTKLQMCAALAWFVITNNFILHFMERWTWNCGLWERFVDKKEWV